MADINPAAEVLNLRWSGVELALNKLDHDAVMQLTRMTFGLPPISAASTESARLADAFKEADAAFPMKGNENLLRVLAGVTLAQCIESKHSYAIFAALCVVSAGCQGLRPAPSVEDLPAFARTFLKSEGQRLREAGLSEEVRVPKFSKIEVASPSTFEIQDTPNQNHWPQVHQNFQSLKTWVGQVSTALQALSSGLTNTRSETAAAFSANAERVTLERRINVLKEESDVLWWLFGEFSEGFDLTWKARSAHEMCFLIGEELAERYAYYAPAPNTEAFLHRALSVMTPSDGKLAYKTAIADAPEEWVRAVSDKMSAVVSRAGAVTPVHSSLMRRLGNAGAAHAQGHPKGNAELMASEYAYQMLVETLLLQKVTHA